MRNKAKRALVILLALCLPAIQAPILAEEPDANPPAPAETVPPVLEV